MEREILIRAQGVKVIQPQKPCLVNGPMIDCLYKAVVLICDLSIKDTDHAIITPTQKKFLSSRMEIQGGDFIIIFSILPPHPSLSAVPGQMLVESGTRSIC